MSKYELAIHNLEIANCLNTENEQLYEENKRDLEVLKELLKENEELQILFDIHNKMIERLKNSLLWEKIWKYTIIDDEDIKRLEKFKEQREQDE